MATRTEKKPEGSGTSANAVTARITVHAGSAPGANTDIPFTDALGAAATTFKVGPNAAAVRVSVCLTTGSVFDVRVTDGTTAYSQHLNGGTALTAACLYTFTFGVRRYSTQNADTELTYAFRVATDSVIQTLFADEVLGGVI